MEKSKRKTKFQSVNADTELIIIDDYEGVMKKSKRKIRELNEGEIYFKVEYMYNNHKFYTKIAAINKEDVEDIFYNKLYTIDSKILDVSVGY